MADNLLYTSELTSKISYETDFSNLLNKLTDTGDSAKLGLERLEEAQKKAIGEERKFYNFFGISMNGETWEASQEAFLKFREKLNEHFLSEDPIMKDYQKLTNTGLQSQSNAQIRRKIAESTIRKDKTGKEKTKTTVSDLEAAGGKNITDKIEEIFYLSTREDGRIDFSKIERSPVLKRILGVDLYFENIKDFENTRYVTAEILDSMASGCSEITLNSLLDKHGLQDFLKGKKTASATMKFSKQDFVGPPQNWENSIFGIFAKAMSEFYQITGHPKDTIIVGEDQKTKYSISIDEKLIYRSLALSGSVPSITLGKTINAEVSEVKIANLQENLLNLRKKTQNPVLKYKRLLGDSWLKDIQNAGGNDKKAGVLISAEAINVEIFNWLGDSINGLGLSQETITLFKNVPDYKKDKLFYIKKLSSSSTFIGALGEILGQYFLDSFVLKEKKGLESRVTGIGDSSSGSSSRLVFEDWWRAGKQPPVDLAVDIAERSDKIFTHKIGIQSKHSFASGAQTSHDVTFINDKPIQDIFFEDLGQLIQYENATQVPKLQGVTLELVSLLESYFGNVAIQSCLEGRKDGDFSYQKIEDASEIINKIFSLYLDVIMDIGIYQEGEKKEEEILSLTRQRNLFVYYLNEYFIPASTIIQWAKQIFSSVNNNPLAKVSNKTPGSLLLSNIQKENNNINNFDHISKRYSEKKQNLISAVKKAYGEDYFSSSSIDEQQAIYSHNLLQLIRASVAVNFNKENLMGLSFTK